MSLIEYFCKNTFILDEHRSMLIARNMMLEARADHGLHYHLGKIYAIGGIALTNEKNITSLTSCEVYSVDEDSWS